MKFRPSETDRRLSAWFSHDNNHAHLRAIDLVQGTLRGL
jgi:hypothetical protein